MKSKKVILDTNIWISFLITRRFQILDSFIESGQIKLMYSNELIEEFITVVKRPKFIRYFSNADVREILRLFNDYGKLIDVKSNITECRDLKDNFLLNLAVDGNVDYLVTGDEDLLVLKKINSTKIITIKELFENLK